MIISTSSPSSPRNKDYVVVKCETCNTTRELLYLVAKRKLTHICNSCSRKKGEYSTGDIVAYQCIDCGVTQSQKYRPQRFNNWRCHHCAMVQGHKDGKFKIVHNIPTADGIVRLSQLAKQRWANEEYRQKWHKTRSSTIEKRRATSKALWADSERLKRLSDSLKAVWRQDDYRLVKSAQSKKLWEDADYVEKHSAGMAKDDAKQKMANARLSQLGKESTIQTMLYKYLDDLKIEYYKEGEHTRLGYYHFDCLVPLQTGGLLIECQGDYWHSLPHAQRNDKAKFSYIQKYHPQYQIMYVWEHEFYTDGRVLDRIKKALKIELETTDFSFDMIELKTPTTKELRSFLDSYHYIGAGRWGKSIGAYIGNKLIGLVVLSNPLRQNTAKQFNSSTLVEISRVCIHPSYHKRNFASWLVSQAIKMNGKFDYVAYSDTTVGHKGTIYKALGFKLHHVVPADYWYIDQNGFAMHKKTLYNRAVKMRMTENDFAKQHGYVQKYGGEKLCYFKSFV